MNTFAVAPDLHRHRKLVHLPDSALAMWTRGGSWSADHGTAGSIPRGALGELTKRADPVRVAEILVDARLWDRVERDYRFHDWDDWQDPLRARTRADAGGRAHDARADAPGRAPAYADAGDRARADARERASEDARDCAHNAGATARAPNAYAPPHPPPGGAGGLAVTSATARARTRRRDAVPASEAAHDAIQPPGGEDPGRHVDRDRASAWGQRAREQLAARVPPPTAPEPPERDLRAIAARQAAEARARSLPELQPGPGANSEPGIEDLDLPGDDEDQADADDEIPF